MELEDHEYPEFKEVSRSIIKKALEEINERSNIFINVEYAKYKKVVYEIKISIKMNYSNLIKYTNLKEKNIEDAESEIFNTQDLRDLLNKYNVTPKVMHTKIKSFIEEGISSKDINKYLFYIKDLNKNPSSLNTNNFLSELSKKENIEAFLQKISAENIYNNEEQEQNDKMLYHAHELVKAIEFIKDKEKLFNHLLDKHKENLHIKVKRNSLYFHELIKNFGIMEILLSDIQKLPDYDFISFEYWKENYLKLGILK